MIVRSEADQTATGQVKDTRDQISRIVGHSSVGTYRPPLTLHSSFHRQRGTDGILGCLVLVLVNSMKGWSIDNPN